MLTTRHNDNCSTVQAQDIQTRRLNITRRTTKSCQYTVSWGLDCLVASIVDYGTNEVGLL